MASKNSIQRYPYVPGMIYDVYCSPASSHVDHFAPGRTHGRDPGDSYRCRGISTGLEMGQDDDRQEVVILRPLQAGL